MSDSHLPAESRTVAPTRLTFVSYGDTHERHAGVATQAEHELVMEAILARLKRAAATDHPRRFALQRGDAMQNDAIALQLSLGNVQIVNRLTTTVACRL